jgi:hypothetical protein
MKKLVLILLIIYSGLLTLSAQEMIKSVEYSDKFDIVFYNETDSILVIPDFSLRYKDIENLLLDDKFYKIQNDTLEVCFQTVVENVKDVQVSESTENTKVNLHYNEIQLKPNKKYHQYFKIESDSFSVCKLKIIVLNFNDKRYQSKISINRR